jgi:lipid A 3-O-deacylase
MNKFIISILVFILLSSSAFSGQLSIMAENDCTAHTDHYFTHGTRIQYTDDNNLGYAIGQNIYTPDNKTASELLPNDRPYAGYLYGSTFDTIYLQNKDEVFAELQLGITGPYSYAYETQKWVHEHIGNEVPKGWSNQIPTHFEFLIIDRYTTHLYENKYFAIDPYVGTYLGNLQDSFNAGVNVYAGYNLPSTRNQQRVIPFKAVRGDNSWNPYGYVYLGLEPKIVLRNMLLTDPRFTIHPNTSVYDRNAGLVLGCKYFELAFTLCLRSKEFEEQPQPEKFGSAKISVNF